MNTRGILLTASALAMLTTGCSDDTTTSPRDSAPLTDSVPRDGSAMDLPPGDGSGTDGPTVDGAKTDAPSVDASVMDAPQVDGATVQTPCGVDGRVCERAEQVCVAKGPIGPAVNYSCEAVPSGCETDRSCACLATPLCNPGDTCSSPADNEVFCDNGTQ